MQHIRVSRDPNTDEDVPIKQADLDFINNRTKIIYVFGRACYKDVFGVDHYLHYCSFYDPGSKAYFLARNTTILTMAKTESPKTAHFPSSAASSCCFDRDSTKRMDRIRPI